MTDIQRVKHFYNKFAIKYEVQLPGRLTNHRDVKMTFLPSDNTKVDIHHIYQESPNTLRVKQLSEFIELCLEQCQQIVLMKQTTDLCSKC